MELQAAILLVVSFALLLMFAKPRTVEFCSYYRYIFAKKSTQTMPRPNPFAIYRVQFSC